MGKFLIGCLRLRHAQNRPGGGSPLSRTSLEEEMLRVKNRQRQLRIALSGTSQKDELRENLSTKLLPRQKTSFTKEVFKTLTPG